MAIRCNTPLRGAITGAALDVKHIGLESIMRTLYVLALAAGATFATLSPASAQSPNPPSPAATAVKVSGVAPAPYRLDRQAMEDVQGVYQLADGSYMRVSTRGNRLVAEINGEGRANMVAVGPKVFIVPATDTVVSFDEDADGGTMDVVLRPRSMASYALAR